jgi:hypothetical protein
MCDARLLKSVQVQLPAIWGLSALLLSYRLGVLPAESAASLKLLDKGVAKEALAALVLVQFPVELVSAVVAGRWAWFFLFVCCGSPPPRQLAW